MRAVWRNGGLAQRTWLSWLPYLEFPGYLETPAAFSGSLFFVKQNPNQPREVGESWVGLGTAK